MPAPANYTPLPLLDGVLLPTTAAVAYTAPTGTGQRGVIIAALRLTNAGAAPDLVYIWVVPSGGARADGNRVINAFSVPADGLDYVLLKAVMLEPGDAIHWQATTANRIAGRIDGVLMED